MMYTYESRPAKFAFLARELFGVGPTKPESAQAKLAVDEMIKFLDSVERYITLPDAGINTDTRFEQMAEDTIRIYSATGEYLDNPKKLYKEDIIRIFEMSMTALPE
jgi:alcohol dehydrogenase class IV